MTAPITPDERAAMRTRYAADLPSAWDTSAAAHGRALRDLGTSARDDVPRLLDALDTAEEFGIGDWRATTWAYEQACAAREAHRKRADTAEAEAARLRAEVTAAEKAHDRVLIGWQRTLADRAANPAPVWDEDAVALAVFERSHEPSFEDSEEGMREAKRFVRSLAVVREHAPVRPDREDVARALWRQTVRDNAMHDESVVPWDEIPTETREWWCVYADAVLALWPGESRATVQAEALRDAADEIDRLYFGPDQDRPFSTGARHKWGAMQAAGRVRARADRLDPKEAPDGR